MNTQSLSLFFVEDNPDDEALTLRAIASAGVACDVTVERHGGEAVATLFSYVWRPPDLIILDFHLPGCNGLEIVRKVRGWRHTRDVPVVMLSALESDKEILHCLRAGANSCVTKPTNAKDFSEFVSMIVRYWLIVDRHPGQMAPSRRFSVRSRIDGAGSQAPLNPHRTRAMESTLARLPDRFPRLSASTD